MDTKTYKFRLRPTQSQVGRLESMLKDLTQLYNFMLDQRSTLYKEEGKSTGYYEQAALFTQIKKTAEWSRLNRWSGQTLQKTLRQLDLAFQSFFRRVKAGESPGYPRFKGDRGIRSATFQNKDGALYNSTDQGRGKANRSKTRKVQDSTVTVYLQGVGHVKVIEHRTIPENAKFSIMTVTRGRQGKWYISVVVEVPEQPLPSAPSESVGIDLGKTKFISASNGQEIDNPRFLEKTLPKLKAAQQRLQKSRDYSKGKRTRKVRERSKVVGDIHEKIENQRRDFHHKVALELVRNYQTIYVEDLNVSQIIQKTTQERGRLAATKTRNTYDVGWGQFLAILKNKAESAGREVIAVDPAYTSQRCFECGHISRDNREWSKFSCVSCGHTDDADHNAALNIQARGRGTPFQGYRDWVVEPELGCPGKSDLAVVGADAPTEAVAFRRPE